MRYGKAILLPLASLLFLAVSCGDGGVLHSESNPTWSSDGKWVAFASNGDIYVAGIDLVERQNITDSSDPDFGPVWSPDGLFIAYQTQGRYGLEINLISPDGSTKTNISNIPATYVGMAWSPDSTKIAFSSNRMGWQADSVLGAPLVWEIYVVSADGSEDIQVTFNNATSLNPTWSPDGTKIAFQSDVEGDFEIFQVDIYGGNVEQLTDNSWPDVSPTWSRDGKQIAFVSSRPKTEFQSDVTTGLDLYLMNQDGTGQFALTNVPNVNFTEPSWSPDGNFLVFDGRYSTGIFNQHGIGQKGINEIYVMGMSDLYEFSRLTENKTNNPDLHGGPVWAPDGKTIAFHSSLSGVSRISIARVIGNDGQICNLSERDNCP